MGYRGDDLDLRTPQTSSASPVDLGGASHSEALINGPRGRQGLLGYVRSGPIWVDDVVLDCCNHAFDIALVHRAPEVRLEHLIHALSRIDAAAEALEARGIRASALRRETAVAIAGEAAVGSPNGKGAPRRSDELEEVLRLAASRAYRRHAPAGVDDLLNVLVDVSGDPVGFARFRPSLQLMRGAYAAEAADVPRERAQGFFSSEPARSSRGDYAATPVDSVQNTRLDALEQMVRALSNDFTSERKVLSGVLQDLQREVMAQRDDTGRLGGSTQDKTQSVYGERLQSLEQALFNLRPGQPIDLSLLHERIGTLERALQADLIEARRAIEALVARPAGVDLAPVSHRLDVIEEAVLSRDLPERLKAVEAQSAESHAALLGELRTLAATAEQQRGEVASSLLAPMRERIDGLLSASETRHTETGDGLGKLDARLAALERTFEDQARQGEEAHAAYTRELVQVRESLTTLNANQHTLAASIEAMREESHRLAQSLSSDIEALERATAVPVAMVQSLAANVEKMNRLTVERYYRRNRFWYWLFGTDDWVTASWRSQAARVAEEVEAVRPVLKG